MMRVGIYARISTHDRDQNLQTQLQPLAEYVTAQGWALAGTWTDEASAVDLKHRMGWKALLDAAGVGDAYDVEPLVDRLDVDFLFRLGYVLAACEEELSRADS